MSIMFLLKKQLLWRSEFFSIIENLTFVESLDYASLQQLLRSNSFNDLPLKTRQASNQDFQLGSILSKFITLLGNVTG